MMKMLIYVKETVMKKLAPKKNEECAVVVVKNNNNNNNEVCLQLSSSSSNIINYCNNCQQQQHGTTRNKTAADEDEDEDEHNNNNNNSSFSHSVINMVGMLTGLGQLSASYAVEGGGWGSAIIFLICLSITCAYTCHLLSKCISKNPNLKTYIDIGQQAFGTKGKLITSALIYTEIFMALVSYTISLHDNLSTVFIMGSHNNNHYLKQHKKLLLLTLSPSEFLTVLAVAIAMPSLWLSDLSSISFLSSAGVFMSLVIFLAVAVITPIFGGIKVIRHVPVFRIHNVPSVSGLFIYSYGGHVVFPNLHKSMKDPSKFTKVIIVSFSIATVLFATLGFMGAKMFGTQVKSQITLSMPRHFIATKIALWATVITPMTKYALEFAPFSIQLHHKLPTSMSRRSKLIIRGTVGSVLLLVILALALSVPYFEDVLSLTGSLLTVFISFILPCAFYIKICWEQISKTVLGFNLCLIALGLVLGVMGTVSSLTSLLNNLHDHHSS